MMTAVAAAAETTTSTTKQRIIKQIMLFSFHRRKYSVVQLMLQKRQGMLLFTKYNKKNVKFSYSEMFVSKLS